MEKIQELNEISIGKVTSKYTNKINSMINGTFSEMINKDLKENNEEEIKEEPATLTSHQVILQNQAYLNKAFLFNVA